VGTANVQSQIRDADPGSVDSAIPGHAASARLPSREDIQAVRSATLSLTAGGVVGKTALPNRGSLHASFGNAPPLIPRLPTIHIQQLPDKPWVDCNIV